MYMVQRPILFSLPSRLGGGTAAGVKPEKAVAGIDGKHESTYRSYMGELSVGCTVYKRIAKEHQSNLFHRRPLQK